MADKNDQTTLIQAILGADYKTLRELRGDVPVDLEQAVLRAMQVDRAARFMSVQALAGALLPHAGAPNRALWQQIFERCDDGSPTHTKARERGAGPEAGGPIMGLVTTRPLRGDQLARLAKISIAKEPAMTLAQGEEEPSPQEPTLRFAPAATAKLDPPQVLPRTPARVLPTRGEVVFVPRREGTAPQSPTRIRGLRLGMLALVLAIAGMGLLGIVWLTPDQREAPVVKLSKVHLPIPAADAGARATGLSETEGEGGLGTKAQPALEATPPSHDGLLEGPKRLRAQKPEKKRWPRKNRGVETGYQGSSAGSPAVAGDAETSEEWLEKGEKLQRAGDHVGALRAFAQAHYLHPSGRTIGQVGLARQSLREWKKSANALTVALESSHEWVVENRKNLEEALVMAKSHIGRLLVLGPQGSDVFLDGFGVGRLPIDEIRMDEGKHVVRVEKGGLKTWSATVKIEGGETTEIRALLEAGQTASGLP